MCKVFICPQSTLEANKYDFRLFLAGSIDMGETENWQDKVENLINTPHIAIFNPRRKSWDNSMEQSIENPVFYQQVNWELEHLEKATHILMYFDPKSKSPISLLEFGLYAKSGKLLVVCPNGFYRKGNVDILCSKYNILQYNSIEEAVKNLGVIPYKIKQPYTTGNE